LDGWQLPAGSWLIRPGGVVARFHGSGETTKMACYDIFENSSKNEPFNDGERRYREHVAAHRLSIGEIVVVVAAAVFLAGMGLVNQGGAPAPRTASAIAASYHQSASTVLRCDDDNRYLSQACDP
jgi:hypothetical protein